MARRRRRRKGKRSEQEPGLGVETAPTRRPGRRRRKPPAVKPEERLMLIAGARDEPQVSILEGGVLVEHYVSGPTSTLVGSIFLGRVQNVLPGMEAAFVDIGLGKNAILHRGELLFDASDLEGEPPRIEQALRRGQAVLVQVTKEPMGSKGARLTQLVTLAGRNLVLIPGASAVGVSRRLPDEERSRLRKLAQEIRPEGFGLIVRTAAAGIPREELASEMEELVAEWREVEARAKRVRAPALVREEPDLLRRVLRDLLRHDISRVVVEDDGVFQEVEAYLSHASPELARRVERYVGEIPLLQAYRVTEELRKVLERRVWLPSGGHVVIDPTEAMTVIDVNTGKYVGRTALEETVFRTNLEAADEIPRLLRLLDIGGIIVVDFIDMEDESNREAVLRRFLANLAKDRATTQVFGMSPLGLVEMTRKRVSGGLLESLSRPCPSCQGRGFMLQEGAGPG